ncbi:MAG: dTDP-4-dehydrorhamnose 3,5-epimerase family protein [Elusimicrobia bacterium]|nr:dTDP-4-dehydrorhamnose 3,5-epimerase family protein [Elusimicrobiota bacterium]
MKFIPQEIPQMFLVEPEPFVDSRGMLRRHFCRDEFSKNGVSFDVRQCNVSENTSAHTLRGFHIQRPPHQEGKILSCMKGSLYDIILDLRPHSRMYMKWTAVELSERNRLSLYLPPGCANAYLTLEKNTWIFYYHSEFYKPSAEAGVRYNDPLFKFVWPAPPAVISQKDNSYPDFRPEIINSKE